MKKRIFFWVLPLLLVLTNFGVLRAQGESYIIVHAVNPEGVEIASIEGVGSGCVAIYDGDTWIGHGIHSTDQCNRPIAISPGNHTVRVEFNGMSLGKNINITEGELKELVFVFNRTQIDLFPIEAVGSHHITRCDRWRIRMNSIWSGNMVNYLWWDGPGSPQPWVLCEKEQEPPIIVFGLDTESLPACATVSGMGYIFFDKSSATFMASIDIEPHEEQIIVKDVSLENLLSEHPYLVESTSAFEYWFLQNLYEGTIPTSPEQRMRKFADACLKKAYSTPDDPHRSTWILYGNSSRTDQYYLIPFPANVDYHLMLDSCHYHTYYSFIEEHPDEYAPYSTENIETKETAAYNLRMSSQCKESRVGP